MIRVEYDIPLTQERFQLVCELITKSYGTQVFVYPGRAEERFRRCGDCYVLAWEGERLVGALSTYPVTRELWEAARTGTAPLDDDIEAEHILPLCRDEANRLFLMDIVVDPDHRMHGVSERLLDGLRDLIMALSKRGYEIEFMFGFSVSEGGLHIITKRGAKVVCKLKQGTLFAVDARRYLALSSASIQSHWGKPFPEALVAQVQAMECAVYGEEIFARDGHSMDRYLACPDYFTWCTDQERLAAFWCTYPVRTELWDHLLAGERVVDDEIGAEWICRPCLGEMADLMVFDLQVADEYRGRGLGRVLLENYRNLLRLRREEGFVFGKLYGFAVTSGGRYMMEAFGAKIVKEVDGGALFLFDLDDFLKVAASHSKGAENK